MEKTTEYCAMDPVLPDLQEAAIPLGAAGGPSGKFQGRPRPRNSIEKALSQRGVVLSRVDARRHATVRSRIPGTIHE